jgi:FG-GAP repeat protein/hemolysin type calcium-binding protein
VLYCSRTLRIVRWIGRRLTVPLLILALLTPTLLPSRPAAASIGITTVSLPTGGIQILGEGADDHAGHAVAGVGDVNGDGFADLLIGADLADANGSDSGAAYLLFGKPGGFGTITLDNSGLPSDVGVLIKGAAAGDLAGISVAGAGDVNGDGFADLLIGAIFADANDVNPGAAYLLFGKASGWSTITLDDSSLPSSVGVLIRGATAADQAGAAVAGAGDVNGDGFADFLVGAPFADTNGSLSGGAYLLFGHASGWNTIILDNSSLPSSVGVLIKAAAEIDHVGYALAGAGDVNGDGFADLLVGSHFADANGDDSGAAYLLFGKASGWSTITLNNTSLPSTLGVLIKGATAGDQAGNSVAGAGDVNGDGFADFLVGAQDAQPNGPQSGAAYLLFGKASGWGAITLDNSSLPSDLGVLIKGAPGTDNAGFAVAGAGDVNGDGFADLLVGAPFANPNGGSSGAASLLFGKASGWGTITLNDTSLPSNIGVLIQGAAADDVAGYAVAGAGDVNGDGFADLLIGAPAEFITAPGAAYLLLADPSQFGGGGNNTLTGSSGEDHLVGGRDDDTLLGNGGPDAEAGGQGNDVLSIADNRFRRLDGGTGLDLLRLTSKLLSLDLTDRRLANRLTDLEGVDLRGGGPHHLILDRLTVLNLSGTSNTVRVWRDPEDTVTFGPGWQREGSRGVDGTTFQVLSQGAARLELQGSDGRARADGVFLDAKGQPAGGYRGFGGDDLFDPAGKGAGGSNVDPKAKKTLPDGPLVRNGLLQVPFRIENDGLSPDRIKLVGISSSRGLAGLTITVNGLKLNDATDNLLVGDVLDGNIVVQVGAGAGSGKYVVVLTLRPNGTSEPAVSDSVTLKFRLP